MATKKKTAAASSDLEVLHPERTFKLAGRDITVREYSFIQSLQLRPLYQPFADDLYQAFIEHPNFDQVLTVIGKHVDAVLELVAVASNVELDWIRKLSADDGNTLLMFWWGACGGFFINRMVERQLVQQAVERTAEPQPTTGARPIGRRSTAR